MDDLLRQLGDLLLGSIPTILIFLVLLFCYATLFRAPLRRTLAERRARTAGAVEEAAAAVASASAKAQEYEAQLRAARAGFGKERERRIAAWNAARDRALTEAREAAAAQVRAARTSLETEARHTREGMDASIEALTGQILARVLPAEAREEVAR